MTSMLSVVTATLATSSLLMAGAATVSYVEDNQEDFPSHDATCQQALTLPVTHLLRGWKLECADVIATPQGQHISLVSENIGGATIPATRTIIIRNAPIPAPDSREEALYHEVGHAWAYDNLTPAKRQEFAQRVGGTGFDSGPYADKPTEIWARSWTHCFGYYTGYANHLVPCKELRQRWGAPVPLDSTALPLTEVQESSFYQASTTLLSPLAALEGK